MGQRLQCPTDQANSSYLPPNLHINETLNLDKPSHVATPQIKPRTRRLPTLGPQLGGGQSVEHLGLWKHIWVCGEARR